MAVTLGGDHSIGLGTLAGSLQHNPDTVVLWVITILTLILIGNSFPGSGDVMISGGCPRRHQHSSIFHQW